MTTLRVVWIIHHFQYLRQMLSIAAGAFQLQIVPVSIQFEEPGGPYLEWIEVQIDVTAPGIQAEGRWSVMPAELEHFQQELKSMDAQLRPGQTAELSGVEPGFRMTLRMLELGAVLGNWSFQPAFPDGAHATGQFGIDQSYLTGLVRGIESLRSFKRTQT